jgi:hypothetical protein
MANWKLLVAAFLVAAIYVVISRSSAESLSFGLAPHMQTLVWMVLSVSGLIVLFFAVFWKRKGSIVERILESFCIWEDAKDRSSRAWMLTLGAGLATLGFYMAVRVHL